MNHETDRSTRLPAAKESAAHVSEGILQERINSHSARDAAREPMRQPSDDFVSIEIHINKKAVDALGKSCHDALNFFPNLIIEGSRAAENGVRQAQQQIRRSLSDAGRSWNQGVSEVQTGFRDASIQTYKNINSGAEHMQRGAVNIVVGSEHAVQSGANRVHGEVTWAVHVTEDFSQRVTHDVAKAASLQLRHWATQLDPDKTTHTAR